MSVNKACEHASCSPTVGKLAFVNCACCQTRQSDLVALGGSKVHALTVIIGNVDVCTVLQQYINHLVSYWCVQLLEDRQMLRCVPVGIHCAYCHPSLEQELHQLYFLVLSSAMKIKC